MKLIFLLSLAALYFFLTIPSSMAAHFIVGIVNDAKDGTTANDRTIVLWNPANGISDNLTDTIGVSGNSGANNIYLIDCELLNASCSVGDEVGVMVFDEGDYYITGFMNLTVTGFGFDVMSNLTLNSPPNFTNITVDDSAVPPNFSANEIDLLAASNRTVECNAVVEELDGDDLQNATAEFFHSSSFYGDSDDNNYHYTNGSCYINSTFGEQNESQIVCGFQILYYANQGSWDCLLNVEDNSTMPRNGTDSTNVNSLLSIGVFSNLDFGLLNTSEVSPENVINVTNYGNIELNLSLHGYAVNESDELSMNCSGGGQIPVGNKKYNLTEPNPGNLNLTEFENLYSNLTNSSAVRKFNLAQRQNDAINDVVNDTYWRIYLPDGIAGSCQGNIVFGAIMAPE